jgi:predicted dehydrogenase
VALTTMADRGQGQPVASGCRALHRRCTGPVGPDHTAAARGGTLLDFGSHLADQAWLVAGPATSVYAEMHYRTGTGGLDDDFSALTHEGGVQSHL